MLANYSALVIAALFALAGTVHAQPVAINGQLTRRSPTIARQGLTQVMAPSVGFGFGTGGDDPEDHRAFVRLPNSHAIDGTQSVPFRRRGQRRNGMIPIHRPAPTSRPSTPPNSDNENN